MHKNQGGNMKRTKFKVNLGVVDYTISLDEQYKIEYIQNGILLNYL